MKVEELSAYGIPENFIKKFKEEGVSELYPPQEEFIKKEMFKEKNLVISLPTAGGKTLIAALAMINKLSSSKCKAIYTVPLVALANEKYEYFKKLFENKWKVAISVGDLDSSDPWLAEYDVIICTNEKLDSLIRHGAPWVKEIGLIVVDEIHLLNEPERGPTLEILLTQLREMVPKAKVLALSATINNAKELAGWLNADLLSSDFRPVKLYEGIYCDSKIFFYNRKGYELSQLEPEAAITENVLQLKKQALFFVATRRTAESLAEKLTKTVKPYLKKQEENELYGLAEEILKVLETPTQQCKKLASCVKSGVAFHHAGLLGKQKRLIEEKFREGLIKIIVATPTLAMGVNLPAFRVVIRDAKRYHPGLGTLYIPVLEYHQMVGRCISGDAIVYTRNGISTVEEIASSYFKPNEVGEKTVDGLELLSIDLLTFSPVFSKVVKISKRKVEDLLEIETKSGKRILLTEDHSLLSFRKLPTGKPSLNKRSNTVLFNEVIKLRKYGWGPHRIAKFLRVEDKVNTIQHWLYEGTKPREECFKWKKAIDLKKGKTYVDTDYLSTLLGFRYSKPLAQPIEFLPKDKLVFKNGKWMNKQGHQSCEFPSQWSVDLCRFIAKIMADGHIHYNRKENSYKITYFSESTEEQEEYKKIVKELFDKDVSIKFRKGAYEAKFSSFPVGAFLVNIGVPSGEKAPILRIPRVIFTLSSNLIEAFIKEYSKCDGWEDSLHIWITTTSEGLAYDFALLISQLGYIARVHKKKPNKLRKRYGWEICATKTQFEKGKMLAHVGYIHPDMIKKITKVRKTAYVYDFTLAENHNFIANGIVVHNCGRPQYDEWGESVLIARTEEEAHELTDHFIMGQLEDIQSKLAVEPILRMHALALIATNFCNSEDSLKKFFSKTFYAYQFGEISLVEEKIERILEQLEDWGFVVKKKWKIFATRIGKRVSELYIDPLTAFNFIQALKETKEGKILPFGILQLISNTIEMRPLLSVRVGEFSEIEDLLAKREDEILQEIPDESEIEFDDFLRSLKTALMFEAWIEEATEDEILTKFRVTPGEFYGRREIADWLVYSLQELALLLGYKEILKHIRKVRVRLEYGVKEELIPLVRLKQIGRIRARKLFNSGIKTLADLKKIPIEKLSSIVGANIAKSIKAQLEGKEEKKKIERQATLKKY